MARKSKKPVDMAKLFLSSKGTLSQIKAKTNSLAKIADIVREICPDLPAEAWQVGNISENTLTIEVKTAVWGQRFQFEKNTIARHLEQETQGLIKQINIKVNPFRHERFEEKQETPLPKTQFISDKTASHLLDVAKNAPDSLKKKLQSLAQLADKKPQ